MEDPLQSRRWLFLKKRCPYRWCYSEDLRAFIFEELLREADRPTPAELGRSARLARILEVPQEEQFSSEGETVEDLLRQRQSVPLPRSVTGVNMLRAMNLPGECELVETKHRLG
ncbi:unnamed protein product [Effrenium voratum]|nr:unnamed protein product [Effrenium voratum]